MFPISNEVYDTGISQPLMFINSFSFQWAVNITSMMKLVTPPDESGIYKPIPLKQCIMFTSAKYPRSINFVISVIN